MFNAPNILGKKVVSFGDKQISGKIKKERPPPAFENSFHIWVLFLSFRAFISRIVNHTSLIEMFLIYEIIYMKVAEFFWTFFYIFLQKNVIFISPKVETVIYKVGYHHIGGVETWSMTTFCSVAMPQHVPQSLPNHLK